MSSGTRDRTTLRQRAWALLIVSLILCGLLAQRKVLPTVRKWQACERLRRDQEAGIDPVRREHELRARLEQLTMVLGDERPAEKRWQDVLARIGKGAPQLVSVAAEHVEELGGRTVHTLPIVVQGRTQDLLLLCDSLERHTDGVHLVSMELHNDIRQRERQRPLQATLHLRTISP